MAILPHPSKAVAELSYNALTGVRVCFINMPLREGAMPNTPPQGPGLLAARLRQYGAEISIIDLNAYRIKDKIAAARGLPNGRHLTYEEAERLIRAHFDHHGEPHVIGLSGKITTLKWQEWTATKCRELVPDAFIISGGGLATEFRAHLFNWIRNLDAVGHSEGDDIMLLAVHHVKLFRQCQNRISDSPYHIGEHGGRHRFVYAGDRPESLDTLPFAAWDLLHEDVLGNPILEWYIRTPVWGDLNTGNSSATNFTMQRSLTTVSSRGCPYACRFCFRGAQGERKWHIRSPGNLRAEAEWLIDTYGVDFIGFPDDNFAVSVKRCSALPEAFAGLDFRWGTHTRLDECTPERLEPMAEAGCVYIGVGAESASKRTLEAMGKGGHIVCQPDPKTGRLVERLVTWQGYEFPLTMWDGIRNCREVGIHTNATWIMGYPGETLEDLKTSVAFITWQVEEYTRGLMPGTSEYDVALRSVNRRLFTATYYPGTTMAEHPTEPGAIKARELLGRHFGIRFKSGFNSESHPAMVPVCDENMRRYVEELDDATKVLTGTDGAPLNYSAMSDDVFLQARAHIDAGALEKVLAM